VGIAAGYTAIHSSQAATFATAKEAEQGVIAGNLGAGDMQGASGGQAIRFGNGVPVQTRKLKIMPLGDSITDGVGPYPGSYRAALWQKLVVQDKLQVDYVGSQSNGDSTLPDKDHEGWPGWRTDQISGKAATSIPAYQPDVILLHTGSNDIVQNTSAAVMTSRLQSLMSNAYTLKPDITIVVASIIPRYMNGTWTAQIWKDYNASIPGLVNQFKSQGKKAVYVDMAAAGLSLGAPDYDADGVHPTKSGYDKMAAAWYPAVKPLFSQ
jgi:lysophospholipase L1-like esterase